MDSDTPKPCCGAAPVYRSWRAAEDLMEGQVSCPACGDAGDVVENVWGGAEMRADAISAWNRRA